MVKFEGTFTGTSWEEAPALVAEAMVEIKKATVTNLYVGDLHAHGCLEYLLVCTAAGHVPFTGVERLVVSCGMRYGSFVMRHSGTFSPKTGVHGSIEVIAGAGSGDFCDVEGRGEIWAAAGEQGGRYRLGLHRMPTTM